MCSALQVQVIRAEKERGYIQAELKCQSSRLSDHRSYVWTKNEQIMWRTSSISTSFRPADRVSCAVKGYEKFPSPSVCEFTQQSSTNISPSRWAFNILSCSLTCSYTAADLRRDSFIQNWLSNMSGCSGDSNQQQHRKTPLRFQMLLQT